MFLKDFLREYFGTKIIKDNECFIALPDGFICVTTAGKIQQLSIKRLYKSFKIDFWSDGRWWIWY